MSGSGSRRCPAASDFNPFRKAAPLFAFNLRYIGVAFAPTTYTILFRRVWRCPVLVLFPAFFFILCGLFKEWYSV